jgi:hypothetical protein
MEKKRTLWLIDNGWVYRSVPIKYVEGEGISISGKHISPVYLYEIDGETRPSWVVRVKGAGWCIEAEDQQDAIQKIWHNIKMRYRDVGKAIKRIVPLAYHACLSPGYRYTIWEIQDARGNELGYFHMLPVVLRKGTKDIYVVDYKEIYFGVDRELQEQADGE